MKSEISLSGGYELATLHAEGPSWPPHGDQDIETHRSRAVAPEAPGRFPMAPWAAPEKDKLIVVEGKIQR